MVNTLWDNGVEIVKSTPFTKSAGILITHVRNKIRAGYNSKHTLKNTLTSLGGKAIAFIFLTYEIYNVLSSLLTDDPISRAEERGYLLQ